jgi:hypothetical protein
LIVPVLAIAGWGVRNEALHLRTSDRAAETFVYGSWPELYDAWKIRYVNPQAAATLRQIDHEAATLNTEPANGIALIADRMGRDPVRYIAWYALQKPYLLWDWNIRLGAGDVNYLDTQNSPLEDNAMLHASSVVQRFLNPLFFALALLGAIVSVRDKIGLPVALFFFYVTAIYVVLQAEPRYSTPFKFAEILLAIAFLAWVQRALEKRTLARKALST